MESEGKYAELKGIDAINFDSASRTFVEPPNERYSYGG